jgi:hypothetical protein
VKSYFINGAYIVVAILLFVGVGYSIEWFRRRSVQKWAEAQGGSFTAGTILAGTPVPEGAAFDQKQNVTYTNVSRFKRPEATYVVAQSHVIWKDIHDRQQSSSAVVCFIDLPGSAFPPVRVHRRHTVLEVMRSVAPGMELPKPLTLAEAVPAFAEQFEVLPLSDAGPVKSETLPPLLPKAVQDELVAKGELVAGLQVRGTVVRLQAVGQQYTYPHEDVFEIAKRLAAAWTAKR